MFWIPSFNHNLPIGLDFEQDLYGLCSLLLHPVHPPPPPQCQRQSREGQPCHSC